MTLTVRLDAALETALERHCAERGVTKSLVVQECLAQYLIAHPPAGAVARPAGAKSAVSANYRAFADAGLIGSIALGGGSADKAAVRSRIEQSFARRKARRGEV